MKVYSLKVSGGAESSAPAAKRQARLLEVLSACQSIEFRIEWVDSEKFSNTRAFQAVPVGDEHCFRVGAFAALREFLDSNENCGNWLIAAWRASRSTSKPLGAVHFDLKWLQDYGASSGADFVVVSLPDDTEWLVYERDD